MVDEDWAADVRKYDSGADDAIIAGIVRYCGIALRTRDASLVAFSDPKETARVRDGYCRKKLALTQSDAEIDAAIAAVGERMKADRTKNRVTVYYLLAQQFDKLELFRSKSSKPAAAATRTAAAATRMAPAKKAAATPRTAPAKKAAATRARASSASVKRTAPAAKPAASAATGAVSAASLVGTAGTTSAPAGAENRTAEVARTPDQSRQPGGGFRFGTFIGVVGLIILAALLAWFIISRMGSRDDAAPMPVANAVAAPAAVAPPPAPDGAGVVVSEVNGRPMVSVYFDTARADIAPGFDAAVAPIKAWVEANPGDRLTVSGFNDPSGDAAFNADLARRRARAVAAALASIGISPDVIDLERPAENTDASVDPATARRVEITVRAGN